MHRNDDVYVNFWLHFGPCEGVRVYGAAFRIGSLFAANVARREFASVEIIRRRRAWAAFEAPL